MFTFTKKPIQFSSSEFVSNGHPDRMCDLLASIVIQDIQAKDGITSHAAIEVFATHTHIIFAGEATTSLDLNMNYLKGVVERGLSRCGYIPEMRNFWSKSEVMLAKDFRILNHISKQSPDIALGTTDKGSESGWNDQGVYFSSSEVGCPTNQGWPMYLAERISNALSRYSMKSIKDKYSTVFGPDNKVVVTCSVKEDGFTPIEVTDITIAISHSDSSIISEVRKKAKELALAEIDIPVAKDCVWVINGTGRFVIHGAISDTSMTGRKISVNHPSAGPLWCNKMIGGGSLTKCAHASDLMLNIASRFIANVIVRAGLSSYCVVGCAGAIGTTGLQSLFIKGDNKFEKNAKHKVKIQDFFADSIKWSPAGLADLFCFFDPEFDFSKAVEDNYFAHPESQPWEGALVDLYANYLRLSLGLRVK